MAKGLCPGVGRSRGIKHEYVNLNERATILLLVYLDNKCLYKKKKKKKKLTCFFKWQKLMVSYFSSLIEYLQRSTRKCVKQRYNLDVYILMLP